MPPRKILAYLLFGSRAEYRTELAFSALSALRLASDRSALTICVVTDQPGCVSLPSVETLPITGAELAEWTLNGSNNFRAKPLALLRVLAHYDAPAVLTDTDTVFTGDPLRLFDRVSTSESLMHSSDGYRIGESSLWAPIMPLIDAIAQEANTPVPLSRSSEMLNSGAIGVHPENASLLERSIPLMDRLYAHTPIFNIEQFAIGAALQSKTHVNSCADLIDHYWGYRRPFIHLRAGRFLESSQSLTEAEQAVQSGHVDTGLPQISAFDRLLTRLRGTVGKWDGDYRFAYLASRAALSAARQEPQIASLWAATAVSSLQRALASPDATERSRRLKRAQIHFHAFSQPAIEQLAWLSPQVRVAWASCWNSSK